jgi:hypothetical protein
MRTQKIAFRGRFEHHHEATKVVRNPGDTALVDRGVARSVVMSCPDGCGNLLTINLDSRSGPAWRLYGPDTALTLFPSVWRETGCRAHFIVWRGQVDWLHGSTWSPSAELQERVLDALDTEQLTAFSVVADKLGEIPWDVAAASRALVARGYATEGVGQRRGWFRRC